MWSRRAQEYEAKINSGDLVSIAEVVRDLFRAEDQPEQSYSERQIFEGATSRLARELAAMEEVDEPTAQEKILDILRKAAAIHNKAKEQEAADARSEEHTSELQSLMRISYAVFCLKKKIQTRK